WRRGSSSPAAAPSSPASTCAYPWRPACLSWWPRTRSTRWPSERVSASRSSMSFVRSWRTQGNGRPPRPAPSRAPKEPVGSDPRSRRHRFFLVLLVLTSITVITLDYRDAGNGTLESIRRTARDALAPIQSATSNVLEPVGNFFGGITKYRSLQKG